MRIKDELPLESFVNYKNLVQKLWESNPQEVLESLPEEEAKVLREIMLSEEPLESKEIILTDCINSIKAESIKAQISDLRKIMGNAENSGQAEIVKQVNQEYLNLNEILRSLVR